MIIDFKKEVEKDNTVTENAEIEDKVFETIFDFAHDKLINLGVSEEDFWILMARMTAPKFISDLKDAIKSSVVPFLVKNVDVSDLPSIMALVSKEVPHE